MFSFLCVLTFVRTTKANSGNLCNQLTCYYHVFDVSFFLFIHQTLMVILILKGCAAAVQFDTIALKPQF